MSDCFANTTTECERRYRSILEKVQLIAIVLNKEGKLIFANDFFLDLTGWERDEALGQDWFDTFLPDHIKETIKKEVFLQAIEDGEFPLRYENEIVTKHGEHRMIAWSNVLNYDEKGTVCGSTSIGEDITERMRAETELIAEKERVQKYLDIAEVMFIALNRDGKVVLANRKACEILEYDEEEILGKNWFESFLDTGNKEDVKSVFSELIEGNELRFSYVESYALTKNNRRKFIAWHNTFLKNEAGEIIGTLSSGEDISERRQAEQALKEKMEELDRFNRLMVGRELKMIELKKEINELLEKYGEPPKYTIPVPQGTQEQ